MTKLKMYSLLILKKLFFLFLWKRVVLIHRLNLIYNSSETYTCTLAQADLYHSYLCLGYIGGTTKDPLENLISALCFIINYLKVKYIDIENNIDTIINLKF